MTIDMHQVLMSPHIENTVMFDDTQWEEFVSSIIRELDQLDNEYVNWMRDGF